MREPILQDPADLAAENQKFRSHVGQISRHSGVFFAGTIFTAVFGYVFKVYLARTLGAEALGIYALGMTVVGLLGIFGGLGLTWAASRFPAAYVGTGRTEELRSFLGWSVLSLVALNGAFSVAIVISRRWIAVKLYHTPQLTGYLYLFAIIMFLGALTTFFAQLLTGYKEVARRSLIANIGAVVLTGIFTVALVQLGTGLWGYVVAQVASALVVLGLLLRATIRFTPKAALSMWRRLPRPPAEMFSFAAAAFTMDVLGFLYSQTDKVILGFYLNARSVGIYAVAAAVVAFIPIALQSVNQIFSPTISDLHTRGELGLLNRLYQSLTRWVFGLTWPLALVVTVLSHRFMRIFGPDFEAGWPILVIGAAGQLVNCGVGSVGFLLLMSGNERRLVRVQLAMGVVTVIACLLLVPRFGIMGAAVAAAAGNAGANIWCLREVKRALGLFPYNRAYWKLTLPIVSTALIAFGLRRGMTSMHSDFVAAGLAVFLLYAVFIVAMLLAGLDADDRFIADALWLRVRGLLSRTHSGGA